MSLPRFIKVKEVIVGDTIAWRTQHPIHRLCYMVVEDLEEGENNFRRYNMYNGKPVYEGEPFPCYVLRGRIISPCGVRTDGIDYPVYKMNTEGDVLLINRNEQ